MTDLAPAGVVEGEVQSYGGSGGRWPDQLENPGEKSHAYFVVVLFVSFMFASPACKVCRSWICSFRSPIGNSGSAVGKLRP